MEAFKMHFPALRDREKQCLLQRLMDSTKAGHSAKLDQVVRRAHDAAHIECLCHYGISLWEASSASRWEEERLNEGFTLIREFAPKGFGKSP